jgi:predicted metal-dependent peptidase
MSLDRAIYHLLKEKPFFAHFIMNSQIMWDAYDVPTAGACVINFTPTLVFNSEFVSKLTIPEFAGVLEHEVNHLIFSHMDQCKELNLDRTIHNIASDWMINQYIEILPKDCITHDLMEKKLKQTVARNETSLYYYNILLQNKDKVEGMLPLDVHDLNDILGDKSVPAQTKIAIKKAINEALKAGAGNTPGHLKNIISDLLKPEKIQWQQVLRNFVSSSISSINIGTRKKIHRRFDLDAPGKRKKRELTLGICRDTSGSVSDDLFSQFLSETQAIMKTVGKAYLIDADCEITNIQVINKSKKPTLERTGYGGTAYSPAIKKCQELKCDAIIYMGDGDSADVPVNPGLPFLWVLPEGCEPPANFGKVLKI